MKSYKRLLLWVTGGLGVILLALLFTLTVVAPRVISSESVKSRIRNEFANAVGGSLDFDRLSIALFPSLGVVVHGASVTVPEKGRGTFETLQVYPRILPLFRGALRIGKLRISEPSFQLDLAKLPDLGKEKSESDTSRSLEKGAASLFKVLASKVPDLEVELEKGGLELVDKGQTVFRIQDLDANLLLPPEGPQVRITCRSNLWHNLSIRGRLDAKSLNGGGHIELSRFQPHLLADHFFPDAGIACSDSTLYLRVDVRTDGLRKFHGEVKTSIPQIALSRNSKETVLQVENLGITFSIEGEKTDLVLDQLKMDSPKLSMSGRFSMDKAAPDVRLDLEARDMDVDAARKAALCLGGNIRVVRDIFDYVRGGEIPVITFRSQADTLDKLGENEAFRIEGRIEDGKIHIRGVDLDPEEVVGDVVISQGILEGRKLEARLGNSRASDGNLRVGLEKGDGPFHLDIAVDADLAEVHRILTRVIKKGALAMELPLVENIEGRALGRLTLGENLRSVGAKVAVSQFNTSLKYRRVPYSLHIESGEFFYDTDSISGRNVSGTLGSSSFSGLTYRVRVGDTPHIEIESGQLRLLMDEIYPWLVSYESIRKGLGLFKDVKGRIELTKMRLHGPLLRTADWDFTTDATVENLIVDTPLCPKPVPIASGGLRATQEELSFNDVKARLLDAPIVASGVLYGYLAGLPKADVDLNGTIGSESFAWVSDDIIHLPPWLELRTPFPLANAKLVWKREGETSFKGNFVFPEGAMASVDLVRGPQTFRLNGLSIQDRNSRATFSITRTGRSLGLRFTGNLTHLTLDKILVSNPAPNLSMKGDFMLNIRRDKPAFSKAQGHLEAKDFTIPYSWMAPIRVEGLSLDASEKGIRVDTAHLLLEESHISLQGDLGFSEKGIQVDMDLASAEVAWDTIERVIDRAKAEEPVDEEAPSSWPRIEGTVRCRTEAFTYGQFTWRPLHASVHFSPEDLRVAVTEADICGISTLGAVNLEGEDLSLDFRLITKDGDLAPTFPCLSDTERHVTGRFDLIGHVHGTARGDAVVRALQGNLELHARNGSVLHDPVLSKVFSLLNVTEVLRGKMPDLVSDKLPYDSLTVKADLKDGNLLLNEAVLSGPTVGIAGNGTVHLIEKKVDVKLIVAPLRTVDFVIERTPVVNKIMGGKLVTVPVRIAGDWRDPDVTMLSAEAVGSRLLGIMKNTIMLPIELAEPALPRQDEKGESP